MPRDYNQQPPAIFKKGGRRSLVVRLSTDVPAILSMMPANERARLANMTPIEQLCEIAEHELRHFDIGYDGALFDLGTGLHIGKQRLLQNGFELGLYHEFLRSLKASDHYYN